MSGVINNYYFLLCSVLSERLLIMQAPPKYRHVISISVERTVKLLVHEFGILNSVRNKLGYFLMNFQSYPIAAYPSSAQLVEALLYKSEGRGFDSRWCHWNFSLTWSFLPYCSPGVDSASNRNEYQEHFLDGQRRLVRRADNLSTFMCRLSWNLGASTCWNTQGLSRAVMGLLYRYLLSLLIHRNSFSFGVGIIVNFHSVWYWTFHLLMKLIQQRISMFYTVNTGTGFRGLASSIRGHKKLTFPRLWRNFCLLCNANFHCPLFTRAHYRSLTLSKMNSIHKLT